MKRAAGETLSPGHEAAIIEPVDFKHDIDRRRALALAAIVVGLLTWGSILLARTDSLVVSGVTAAISAVAGFVLAIVVRSLDIAIRGRRSRAEVTAWASRAGGIGSAVGAGLGVTFAAVVTPDVRIVLAFGMATLTATAAWMHRHENGLVRTSG